MDINPKLDPDILSDLREFKPGLEGSFDQIICADVLEHMPFDDLEKNLRNIHAYLAAAGKAIITIPHRGIQFMFINSFSPWEPFMFGLPAGFCFTPRAFYSRFIKKEIWKDPTHCWEIGDGRIKRRDVQSVIKRVGFNIHKLKRLLYVDLWVLEKERNNEIGLIFGI
jgi:cyclopropane fatty-acyl-phospholipid synthase-like methyltransferase